MAFSNIDRTAEVETCEKEVAVRPTDYCYYFNKHPDTLLWRKECWTCSYSDFGIDKGAPTMNGICKIKSMPRGASCLNK